MGKRRCQLKKKKEIEVVGGKQEKETGDKNAHDENDKRELVHDLENLREEKRSMIVQVSGTIKGNMMTACF